MKCTKRKISLFFIAALASCTSVSAAENSGESNIFTWLQDYVSIQSGPVTGPPSTES